MVRKHSPSASRSVSEPFVAFSAEASASNMGSGGSQISAVSSFWSAMKPNRFILSMQSQQRCDSPDVIDDPRLSMKLVPLFNMLLPQPHLIPSAPCAWGAGPAVGMGSLWGCRSANWPWLGYFWKEPSPDSAAHVQGAHSSPTLGLHSLMSCLSQFLSPPGKANFPSSSHFPTSLQAKPTPVPPNSPELTLTSPGTGRTPVADFAIRLGMLSSTLQAWQKRKCLNASVHWGWV